MELKLLACPRTIYALNCLQVSTLETTLRAQLDALQSSIVAERGPVQQHAAGLAEQGKALQLLSGRVCSAVFCARTRSLCSGSLKLVPEMLRSCCSSA